MFDTNLIRLGELGNFVVACVMFGGALLACFKMIIRQELTRFERTLDRKYEKRFEPRRTHMEVH